MARIWGLLNLLVFIEISSIIRPEKILLLKPVICWGDYPSAGRSVALDNGIGGAIAAVDSAASSKLKELAKDVTAVDDKSKKKGRGGGKSEAEQYSDIVDSANRRITSLKAEEAALGMTEQAALALKYEAELLNQAQQSGINLTAAQRAELSSVARQMRGKGSPAIIATALIRGAGNSGPRLRPTERRA